MRQFLLAKNVAYATGSDLLKVAEGAVGVFYNNNGVLSVTATGAEINKEAMLVLGRKAEHGGPVVLPLYKNNFSFSKMAYAQASTFNVNFVVPSAVKVGDYTLMVVAKGKKFNERNKWTAMVHVVDNTMTAANVAKALADGINANPESGVTATVSSATITIKAATAGIDFEVIGADNLMGMSTVDKNTGITENGVTVTARGEAGQADANYVADLAAKAAADAGFEYTYRDAVVDLYPNHPLNPLAQPNSTDAGYVVFTLRFAEPRAVATTDEVVNQIVQVAFPTGASAISTFETVCNALAGVASASPASMDDEE